MNDNVVKGPGVGKVSSKRLLEDLIGHEDEISTLIVITEWKDGHASLGHTEMSPRDLWWQVTNACMRVWNMIGGVRG